MRRFFAGGMARSPSADRFAADCEEAGVGRKLGGRTGDEGTELNSDERSEISSYMVVVAVKARFGNLQRVEMAASSNTPVNYGFLVLGNIMVRSIQSRCQPAGDLSRVVLCQAREM